jgi:DNA-binding CsgD family transcriptional regulator
VNSWNLDAIAQSFADAAVVPALWVKAMDIVAFETNSIGSILLPITGQIPNVPVSDSVRCAAENYFRDGWHLRDERFRGQETMISTGVADDFDCTTTERMKKLPYYQEFLLPLGLQYFAGVKMAAGDDIWALSIQRSPQQGPFTPGEKRKLAALSQKIASAAALARALGFATANAAVEALELSGSAIGLLNRSGEVLRLNRAAEALLSPELRIVDRRIVSQDRETTAALDRTLHALLWAGTNSALMPPVALPRRGRRPILAYAVRLSTVSTSIFADCQALLVFIDQERRPRPPQDALKASYALTPAEARLATRISSGEVLESIAEELCISKQTARNQLKSVFQKTGVRRQAELVALLSSFLYLQKGGP